MVANSVFGDSLRSHRQLAGLTQEALAERAGVSARTISDLERGVFATAKAGTACRLADALELAGEERLLFLALARGEAARPVARAEPQTRGGALPCPASTFVGRTAELWAAVGILVGEGARLLTLTGPGGSGKTRVAIEAARIAAAQYPDGVRFVGLGSLANPEAVVPAIAASLGLGEAPGRVLEDVVRSYLSDRRLLLLLDTCEHLPGAAPAIGRLLEAGPGLAVLATSRVPLHLAGERLLTVPPMTFPRPRDEICLEELLDHDAPMLFVQRARALQPDFAATAENAHSIAAICARVDGLPLGIELAAARVRYFPLPALLARLTGRLDALGHGPCDAPARQQTLQGTVDWSYRLLDRADRALFRRLSVFAGGFPLQLAEAVCGAGSGERLARLLEASLLEQVGELEPRFTMLDTIREVAAARLAESGEEAVIRQRHAEALLCWAERAKPQLAGPDQADWLRRVAIEHANLRAALRHLTQRGQGEPALRLATSLARFWVVRGYWEEGARWLREGLAVACGADPTLRAQASTDLGWLDTLRGRLTDAATTLQHALSAWQGLGDLRGAAQARLRLAECRGYLGERDDSDVLLEEAVAGAWTGDDLWLHGELLTRLGENCGIRGHYERAAALAQECLRLAGASGDLRALGHALRLAGNSGLRTDAGDDACRYFLAAVEVATELRDARLQASCLHNLGFEAWTRSDFLQAASYYLDAVAAWRDVGCLPQAAGSLSGLAEVARAAADLPAAAEAVGDALLLLRMESDPWELAHALDAAARLAADTGGEVEAAQLWAVALGLLRKAGAASSPPECAVRQATLEAARLRLGSRSWRAAWDAGKKLGPARAIDLGLGYVDALRNSSSGTSPRPLHAFMCRLAFQLAEHHPAHPGLVAGAPA